MSESDDTNAETTTTPSEGQAQGQGSGMSPAERGRVHLQTIASATGSTPPEVSDEQAAAIPSMVGDRLGELNANANGGGASSPAGVRSINETGTRGLEGGYGAMSGSLNDLVSGQKAGQQYDGRRHVWDVLGYPESGTVDPESYYQRAARQSPAWIIANVIPATTWKQPPTIIDDVHDEPQEDKTQFEKDVQSLIDADKRTNLRRGITHYFEWMDRTQRPGHFGIMFFGVDDGKTKDQPVDTNAIGSPEDLVYLRPYRETEITGWTVGADIEDDGDWGTMRPDQPAIYEVKKGVEPVPGLEVGPDATGKVEGITKSPAAPGSSTSTTAPIHYSRTIHVAETPTISEWIGQPCLEPLLNRLIDHEKTVGASAEMFWSGADRKFFLSTASGVDGSDVDDELVEWIDEQFSLMNHNMRQSLYTRYMDLEVIDGQSADPSPVVDALYDEFAGVSGIPKRMMRGSERGDLASSMDEANFFGGIHERQTEVVEPVILRPAIDRWMEYGAIADPEGGTYTVRWPSLFDLTDAEKAEIKNALAQAYLRAEDAISVGADRATIYEDLGLAMPEGLDTGETDTTGTTSGEDPETADPAQPDPEADEEGGGTDADLEENRNAALEQFRGARGVSTPRSALGDDD